jgi:hypothetical protein
MSQTQLEADAHAASNAVLDRVVRRGAAMTVVDSPPGAGKTWLVERMLALASTSAHRRVLCVTNTNPQARDVVRRVKQFQLPTLRHLVSSSEFDNADPAYREKDPRLLPMGPGVVVSTLKKALHSLDRLGPTAFDLVVIDEAYQASGADALAAFALSQRFALVGDPGQLDPVVTTDTAWFEASEHRVHRPAPKYLLDRGAASTADIIRLPATRRLVQDTVDFVQPSFYPTLPFASLAAGAERTLNATIDAVGNDYVDAAIAVIEAGCSIVQIVLPPAPPRFADFDAEVPAVIARIVRRLQDRGVAFHDGTLVADKDIICIDPHVASGEATRQALRGAGHSGVHVDTPERYQGLQSPIVIAKHPLTDMVGGASFGFDPGRWCVSLSRHTHACIVVARADIGDKLDGYVHSLGDAACEARDAVWNGYSAHSRIWKALAARGRNIATS